MTTLEPRLLGSGPAAAPAGEAETGLAVLGDGSSTVRRVTVRPAMCGHNSLFVGQIGDWTWDAVSAVSGIDVLTARNQSGAPAYLSFYYFHIRASPRLHLRRFTFGDRLEVTSRVFGFGSESVHTLHRIRPAAGAPQPVEPLTEQEFFDRPHRDCLYVENFNRWVSRSRDASNEGLVRASPVGFRHEHLPGLDPRHSPRLVYDRARTRQTFRDPDAGGLVQLAAGVVVDYPLDVSRDFNGVGLVYFAAYFSILDWALLRLWRRLGRDDRQFMDRVVLDHKVCYLGNADVGTVLAISMDVWRVAADPRQEVVDLVLRDRATGRRIAVSTLHLLTREGT